MEVPIERIKYLKEVSKMSNRQISKELGISRKRLPEILNNIFKSEVPKKVTPLDRYQSLIVGWFKEYPNIKGKLIYSWLKERGLGLSYTRMIKYIRPYRPKKLENIYHDLSFLPGEEGQVDWFFVNDEILGKICCFAIVLSYSRYLFVHAFLRSSFEFFIEGHLLAFSKMNGLPRNFRYDNLRSVVIKRKPEIEYNPAFLEFARFHGVGIRVCNPASGNEKGRVERAIRTIKENFFTKPEKYSSIKSLNNAIRIWVEEKNNTLHRSTNRKPIDMFMEEKLRPLPSLEWSNIKIHTPVRTTKTGMMIFDTNSYSIPDYLTGKDLVIHSSTDKISIYDKNNCVANHPRSFKKNTKILNPVHRSFKWLSTYAKMDRIYSVMKNMDESISIFLNENERCDEDPKNTAYEIFKLLKDNSRGLILSVIRECLHKKSTRLKSILSFFMISNTNKNEEVLPQRMELLNITYKPRSLETYDEIK